ncbi:T9SS type A sorting domain-containing protein [Portibacter marinus]|uniref:T9SS type A sorting domain-containing protein n=1 Tax=Portibacter marinus TaxID=2898660 RepID=UPI001F428E82|nr:T9SS type A sorting domain-containing protein [Portibacter marinus]
MHFDNSSGLYGVNYQGFIPYLIKGVQEQQIVIDSLSQEITNLKNALTDIALNNIDNTNETDIREDAIQIKGAKLFQNIPNPTNQATTINYDLPKNIKTASINVYNVRGKMVKTIAINSNKKGSVIMRARDLKPGIYVYTLSADGTLIDSKQMVITK